jgi:hypothetical protein
VQAGGHTVADAGCRSRALEACSEIAPLQLQIAAVGARVGAGVLMPMPRASVRMR